MRKLLLLTLSAGATFAQLPQDALRNQLYAPKTVKQKFLAETPGAVEERRTEHSVHFRRPDGTRVALISQYLHWRDPETGQLLAVEPALWTLDNGWRLEGGPVKARIVRSGTTWTFELYQQRDDKQWKTISFTIPAPSYDQGLSFSFTYKKLPWKLKLTETGFDLTAEVAARQGSQTYSLPLAARLLDLSVEPDTGHLTGNGFALTRAVMVRADRNRTPCSAWRVDGGNASFTCDDSDFPAEAFPYVIDPTGSFYPTAAGDDAWAEAALYGTYGCPAWPGALAASGYWGGTTTTINQTWSSSAFYTPSCWKYSHQSYVRFDTSSIPSGSTISAASVSVYAASVQDGNQDLYGGAGCAVQADWYASSNWPLTYNEWSLWGAGDAVAPQDLTGKTPGWYSFTLANLTNIPVGAGAYAGLKWSVPCEPMIQTSGNLYNEFTFYSFDNGPSTKPYLSITYSQPAVQHVITSAPVGRSLTVDGAPCIAPCTFQWTAGTQHTIATTTPQAGATGTQYVFSNWSDGGAISHSITASSSPATYTANFTTQYYLTTAASPPAGGTISPASGWRNSGVVVAVSAAANSGYVFSGFTGALSGTTTPQNLTMNAPKSVTANFTGSTVQHVITSAPAGRSLTVDGAPCTAPCTFFWTPGTGHTIATTTPQSGGSGTRYVFASWSDGGAISHSITASSSPATYTANFTTQYYLTTGASPSAGGTISPASSWRNSGSVVSVSATANSGYQFTGFSGALSGTTTPQNLTMNAPKTVTANFAAQQQYYLTTAASPPAGGTITPASGWYNAGTVVSVSATANSGYQFTGFSGNLSGTTTPQNLTMNAAKSVTANFTPAPLVLPTPLKGFVYFPRGHAWYSVLYDWYTQDCATSTIPESCAAGLTVGQVVSNDLQRLASNGFNFIHLYLWDQDIVQGGLYGPAAPLVPSGLQAPGFVGLDNGGPENSPANITGFSDPAHNQWTALAEFISQAKNRGLWVFVNFAVNRPAKKIQGGSDPANVGTEYGNWVNRFVDYLAGYQNVLIWGITYGTGQPIGGPFWHSAYPMVASRLQQYNYTSPAGRALLAAESPFGVQQTDVLPYLSGYRWTWEEAQQEAYNWQQLANDVGFFSPDVYGFQLWNANAGDLQANLKCVAGIANALVCPTSTCGANCAPIPLSKMVVTEFGTGSSLESPPIGNGMASYGDAQTPTTTADGQREWVTQTLCLMNRLNITKYAYHGLYDSASFWEPYAYTASQLAWVGYLGLSSEDSSFGDKPAWSALVGFNPNNCPAPNVPPTPVIALQADASYYTVNDTGKITYTAANVTSLSLNEPKPLLDPFASYSCDPVHNYAGLHPDLRVGSCAYANIQAAYTGTITLTGENTDVDGVPGAGVSTRVATSVTVGLAPIVYGVVNYTTGQVCNVTANPGCVITASRMDILEIYGVGFRPTGGNTVKLANGSTEAWLYETDGYYFWDQSRTQLNAQIACYVTPGAWTLYVYSPNSGTPSNGVLVSISAGSSCP